MAVPARKVPSYCRHKASGQAYVTINGRERYLGIYGSPARRELYAKLIAEHLIDAPPTLPATAKATGITVAELALRYWEQHVLRIYVRDGRATDRQYHIRLSLRPLSALFSDTLAVDFGPKSLKAVREKMIVDQRQSRGAVNRKYVNDHIGIIKRMFRWAVAEELVPVDVYQALQAVENLRKGWDPRVSESQKVKPAPIEDVEAVLRHVSPQIATMIQVQVLTGMRPDEVTIMRPCDIDRSHDVWTYIPGEYKLEHIDIDRIVSLGPQAQELLEPWLNREANAFLFSPREVVETARQQRGRRRAKYRSRAPRNCYDDESYCQAVERGCQPAGVPKWTPGQLRHNTATEIRRKYGIEAARLILGHRSTSTTEIYAERNQTEAMRIMKKSG